MTFQAKLKCTHRDNKMHSGDRKMYTSGTIANSQRMPTKINKNGATAKVKMLVEQVIL